jgi:hypothetical protein
VTVRFKGFPKVHRNPVRRNGFYPREIPCVGAGTEVCQLATERTEVQVRLSRIAVPVTLLLTFAACSDQPATDPTAPSSPSGDIVIASGDGQTGLMAVALPKPISVRVADEHGSAMADVVVVFAATSGGGGLEPATVSTDVNGLASATAGP